MNRKIILLLLILTGILIVIVQPICLAQEEEEEEVWGGADGEAEEMIGEIAPDYEPWFDPLWEPPSGEIESLLFSSQAAIGALIIGFFFGYYQGKKEQKSN